MEIVTKGKRSRYDLLDTIRGIVLVSMIIYHTFWNFVYLYGMNWNWYQSYGAYLWQQSICWTFILLSGFCFSMGKNPLKNGLLIWGSGGVVTLVTLVFMPENRVIFGVLTCIGSCILLTGLLQKYLKRIPSLVGGITAFLLFLLTQNINAGILGWGKWKFGELPQSWYRNYVSTYLGFPFKGFYSTDYFSLFPWFFLFITGVYLYEIFKRNNWLKKSFFKYKISLFSFLGRHSLLIYLLHQPVIFSLQELIFR